MNIERVPKNAGKQFLAGLKVGDLVQTTKDDYSQVKGSFETKVLPARSVGRVKSIYDFGFKGTSNRSRFLVSCKFDKHPITNFYSEELVKVRV
jgi:hypothetical protein